MKLSEFKIGESFWCSDRTFRCTDVGSRVVVAIRTDRVEIVRNGLFKDTLSYELAKKEGWFNGPPYALAEQVFDENDFVACHPVGGTE
jgi:hypothetical protein